MSAVTKADPASPAGSAGPLKHRRPLGDRGFQILALAAGLLVLVILVLIAVTTAQQSTSWFTSSGFKGIFSTNWDPTTNSYGAMAFMYGTVISSVIAIIIACPISIAVALLLTEVVPRRWAQPIVTVIAARRGAVGGLGPVGHHRVRSLDPEHLPAHRFWPQGHPGA